MQHAGDPARRIARAAVRIEQDARVRSAQAESGRVDREVAAIQVALNRRGLHDRQRGGRGVALAAGADEVDARAVGQLRGSGAEAVMGRPAQPGQGGGERGYVAFDGQIEVQRRRAAQCSVGCRGEQHAIAQRPADQIEWSIQVGGGVT